MEIEESAARFFDLAGKVILELSKEVEDLGQKFGPQSKIVQRKGEQVATLISFHTEAQKQINLLRRALHLAMIVHKSQTYVIMKHETGLSWEKIAQLNGWDTGKGEDMDKIEDKWNEFIKELNFLTGNDGQQKEQT